MNCTLMSSLNCSNYCWVYGSPEVSRGELIRTVLSPRPSWAVPGVEAQSARPPLPLKAKRLLLYYKTVIWAKYYLKYLVNCLLMTCGICTVILPLKSKGWLKASICGFICLHCPKLVKLVLQFVEVKMVSAEFLIHIICFKYYI